MDTLLDHPSSPHKLMFIAMQPMLMRPFCAIHQVRFFYHLCLVQCTYELNVLAADGLLDAVRTNAANRGTVDAHQGAKEGVGDAQKAGEETCGAAARLRMKVRR